MVDSKKRLHEASKSLVPRVLAYLNVADGMEGATIRLNYSASSSNWEIGVCVCMGVGGRGGWGSERVGVAKKSGGEITLRDYEKIWPWDGEGNVQEIRLM